MKQMAVSKIPYGETFRVFGDTFVALDRVDGGVLAIRRDIWKKAPFDNYGCNDIRSASIKTDLSDYMIEVFGNGGNYESIIKTNVDLKATDGTREYGFFRHRSALLTLEQYGKYQHIIPDTDDRWWLATPFRTPREKKGNCKYSWIVDMRGMPLCGFVMYANGIRPVLVFAPSLLVEYGGGEEESDITDGENALYEAYLYYVFCWVNENDEPKIGESPISYKEWKRHNKEP